MCRSVDHGACAQHVGSGGSCFILFPLAAPSACPVGIPCPLTLRRVGGDGGNTAEHWSGQCPQSGVRRLTWSPSPPPSSAERALLCHRRYHPATSHHPPSVRRTLELVHRTIGRHALAMNRHTARLVDEASTLRALCRRSCQGVAHFSLDTGTLTFTTPSLSSLD